MSQVTIKEKLEAVIKTAKETQKQLKVLHENAGSYETPIDTDMVKTMKAMGYEKIIAILKRKEE